MAKQVPVILAGGKGTRLSPVVEGVPKPMAEVNGRPFLSYLFDQLLEHRFSECVLCTGYKSEDIISYFGDGYDRLSLIYSTEFEPLGTGGALKNALALIGDKALVMNGDSYCNANLIEFAKMRDAMLVVRVEGDRYGGVSINDRGEIVQFAEKEQGDFINAGIYSLSRRFIESIPDGKVSLEHDVFPSRRLKAYITNGEFIDIGTPESYAKANGFFRRLGQGRHD